MRQRQSLVSGRGESGGGARAREEWMKKPLSNEDWVWGHVTQQEEGERERKRAGLGYQLEQHTRSLNGSSRGTFAASFYQNLLNKPKRPAEQEVPITTKAEVKRK